MAAWVLAGAWDRAEDRPAVDHLEADLPAADHSKFRKTQENMIGSLFRGIKEPGACIAAMT